MLLELYGQAELLERSGFSRDRFRSPGDLVARMRPRFPAFGITRLAEITNLDRVGHPVWAAVRPNAPTLSVCQGKGPTAEAAQASAVMEAVETAAAERIAPARVASAAALAAEGAAHDLLPSLLRRGRDAFGPSAAIGWVKGHDLTTGGDLWLPHQAVRIEASEPDRRYWQSTDGIGSGSLMIEAVTHGLLERIERDAVELAQLRSDEEVAAACLDLGALGSPAIVALDRAVSRAGLHLRAFDVTSDLGIPAAFATVSPPPDGRETRWHHFDLASGSAARPELGSAVLAAIAEALQSRLTVISGARDDIAPEAFARRIAPDLLVYPRAVPTLVPRRAPAVSAVPALHGILERLAARAVGRVIVVPLHEDRDCAVAKIVVPGLELPPGARAVAHGERLGRRLDARP